MSKFILTLFAVTVIVCCSSWLGVDGSPTGGSKEEGSSVEGLKNEAELRARAAASLEIFPEENPFSAAEGEPEDESGMLNKQRWLLLPSIINYFKPTRPPPPLPPPAPVLVYLPPTTPAPGQPTPAPTTTTTTTTSATTTTPSTIPTTPTTTPTTTTTTTTPPTTTTTTTPPPTTTTTTTANPGDTIVVLPQKVLTDAEKMDLILPLVSSFPPKAVPLTDAQKLDLILPPVKELGEKEAENEDLESIPNFSILSPIREERKAKREAEVEMEDGPMDSLSRRLPLDFNSY